MAHCQLCYIYIENILLRSKKNIYVAIVLYKFPNIIRYIFNMWREINYDLNAHVIYSSLGHITHTYIVICVVYESHGSTTCNAWNRESFDIEMGPLPHFV